MLIMGWIVATLILIALLVILLGRLLHKAPEVRLAGLKAQRDRLSVVLVEIDEIPQSWLERLLVLDRKVAELEANMGSQDA